MTKHPSPQYREVFVLIQVKNSGSCGRMFGSECLITAEQDGIICTQTVYRHVRSKQNSYLCKNEDVMSKKVSHPLLLTHSY